MFKETLSEGADPFDVLEAIRQIREVHEAFVKWIVDKLSRDSNNQEFRAAVEGDALVITTPAGKITSNLEFIRDADGSVIGRLVFYEPEKKSFGLPVRSLFAIRLKGDYTISSGDEGTRKWERREHTGWLGREAPRLGHELLLAQLTPRG